jgi:hypothetical protein
MNMEQLVEYKLVGETEVLGKTLSQHNFDHISTKDLCETTRSAFGKYVYSKLVYTFPLLFVFE